MEETPTRASRIGSLVPRFGLRALLLAVVLVAVFVQLGQLGWRQFVRYQEAHEYATKQATKKWSGSDASLAIDDSRGVPDDFVILVRRGNEFGCFIPRNQYKKGESLEYDWYYRTDGLGRFDPDDPKVRSGHSFAGPYVQGSGGVVIKFGRFEIPWSGNGPGWGFVYFDYNPPDRKSPDILRICATDVKSLDYLDARQKKWIYKAFPGDEGISGNTNSGD